MKKLMKYLVGDVEEKRAWRRTMKRVATLPADYRFVYEKIVAYIWSFAGGTGMDMLKTQYVSLNCLKKAQPKKRMF